EEILICTTADGTKNLLMLSLSKHALRSSNQCHYFRLSRSTLTLRSVSFSTAMSSSLSPFRSAVATETGSPPTVNVLPGAKVPSPLKSATATSSGKIPTKSLCCAWKVPSLLPSRTETVPSRQPLVWPHSLTTSRSRLPSPFTSATARSCGPSSTS